MCTPASSDRSSIPQSAHSVLVASWSLGRALAILLGAILTAPGRLGLGVRRHARAAPVGGIDIQIHLEDQRCIANLRRVLRLTLRRSAATWAPMALPVDRIVVGAGFHAEGKADIYNRFTAADGDDNRLIVISLGLRSGDRDLEPFEIAGALAAQIQRVIDDVHRDHARVVADASIPSAPTNRLTPAAIVAAAEPALTATPVNGSIDQAGRIDTATLPRLQELIATVQEGQPRQAAGPNSHSADP